MKTKTIITLSLCCWLTIGLISGCTKKDKDVKVLKLAHALDTKHPVHKGMVFMAEKVKEKSGGRLQIDIYPSGQLGSERECIEQLQAGALAITKSSSSALEAFIPKMKVLGLPYLFRDSDHYWDVLLGPVGKEFLSEGPSCRSCVFGREAERS